MKSVIPRIAATVVALGMAGSLAGCSSAGAIKLPASQSPSSVATPSSAATTSPASTTPASSPVTTTTSAASKPAKPKPPAKLVLADTGIGGIYLGQPKSAAMATGLIGKNNPDAGTDDSEGCTLFHGKQGVQWVYFHQGKVIIIAVGPSISTDKGLSVGSTYLTLHEKYPSAGTEGEGRVYVDAPGAKIKASYRIGMKGSDDKNYPDDTVTDLALQGNNQPCYE